MAASLLPGRALQRRPLLGVAALLLLLAAVAAFQIGRRGGAGGSEGAAPPAAAMVAFRDLRFEDRADGAVTVQEAGTGAPVAVLDPGTNGFIRGTLRGLARERRLEDAGRAAPFRVAKWADGRITLEDRATGRLVDLDAFGHTNAEAFARFLTLQGGTP